MHKKKLLVILGVISVAFISIFTIKTMMDKKGSKVDINVVETSDIAVQEEDNGEVDKETNEGSNEAVEEQPTDTQDVIEEPIQSSEVNEGDAPYDTDIETSDKFEFVSDDYKLVESSDEYVIYEHVFQNGLSVDQICTEECFYEFLCEINFSAGSLESIECIDESWQLYHVTYENAELDYSFNKNKLTLVKQRILHD